MIDVDEQDRSPFRAAVESKSLEAIWATLADGIVFRSPAVHTPYEGREAVGTLMREVAAVILPELVYKWQMRAGDREVLCFRTVVDGREVEGVDLLRYDDQGLLAELTVMLRPASGLMAVANAIGARLSAASEA